MFTMSRERDGHINETPPSYVAVSSLHVTFRSMVPIQPTRTAACSGRLDRAVTIRDMARPSDPVYVVHYALINADPRLPLKTMRVGGAWNRMLANMLWVYEWIRL